MGDEVIQATNDDAAMCKRFAVQQGYWSDPYLPLLIRSGDRKAPEINRGYYVRTHGLKTLMHQFLEKTKCACQIVNLGAGFDTTFWQLNDEGKLPDVYVELDFRAVTSRKCQSVRVRPKLLEGVQAANKGQAPLIEDAELHSARYHITWADMRNIEEFESKLTKAGIDKSKPTLFVAECVLVYLPTDKSSTLLKWIATNFQSALFLNFEQINLKDRFGQVMIDNLRRRQCDLAGADACESLQTQKDRFLSVGWEGAEGIDTQAVYNSLPADDIYRIERLEFLDEAELLHQLLQHYCITWAWKDSTNLGLSSVGFGR
ncbi:leucine carboxyl methyltransferase 1-like [Amphiura filiformis]|uniref:leucine carboxyl methyltransferase 1-like n=1 Tax=Amphiura filiformis TaxID=82378 RepID=UPI003B227A54